MIDQPHRGPEWRGWEVLFAPSAILWETKKLEDSDYEFWECWIAGKMVAWMEKRPYYCDRGHFVVNIKLPGIDDADMFPRYYFSQEVAKSETELFLKWRLWRER